MPARVEASSVQLTRTSSTGSRTRAPRRNCGTSPPTDDELRGACCVSQDDRRLAVALVRHHHADPGERRALRRRSVARPTPSWAVVRRAGCGMRRCRHDRGVPQGRPRAVRQHLRRPGRCRIGRLAGVGLRLDGVVDYSDHCAAVRSRRTRADVVPCSARPTSQASSRSGGGASQADRRGGAAVAGHPCCIGHAGRNAAREGEPRRRRLVLAPPPTASQRTRPLRRPQDQNGGARDRGRASATERSTSNAATPRQMCGCTSTRSTSSLETIPLPKDNAPLTINRPLPLGLYEDGTVLEVLMQGRASKTVGLRGKGKSNLINAKISALDSVRRCRRLDHGQQGRADRAARGSCLGWRAERTARFSTGSRRREKRTPGC